MTEVSLQTAALGVGLCCSPWGSLVTEAGQLGGQPAGGGQGFGNSAGSDIQRTVGEQCNNIWKAGIYWYSSYYYLLICTQRSYCELPSFLFAMYQVSSSISCFFVQAY